MNDQNTDTRIVLRWLDISEKTLCNSLLLEATGSTDMRDRALARLDITRQDGEGHLAAWCRVMAEENNLPHETPAHPRLASAIAENCSRWLWFLA